MAQEKEIAPGFHDGSRYQVLLIGGYGFFGKKLAERLALDGLLQVTIAGRDFLSAQRLADSLNRKTSSERFSALQLDVTAPDLCESLKASGADVVIHVSGPFQGQGYEVARACIRAGVHYVDLADASEFVAGIGCLDSEAKNADVLITSGASSVPALSSAVVDALSDGFATLHGIDIGISPGNRTDRGLATVKGILSYCGAPFRQWRQGQWQQVFGWQDLRRQQYLPPVSNRWLANCDVPDLILFPERYAGVQSVRFQAGLELPFLHFGLWLMAGMRRAGMVKNWSSHATALKKLGDLFIRFGSDAGAMHVEVDGMGHDGLRKQRRWMLIAEDGDGPYVPTLASAALVGKLARNQIRQRGACPCVGLLDLQDFSNAMSGLTIAMGVEE
jgi:saccharopine dehydrogenase-like NADP-dependent oxidoreductase